MIFDFLGFKKNKEDLVRDCTGMIEQFLKSAKLNPSEQKVDDKNMIGWYFIRGSAEIYLFITDNDGLMTFEVFCPILKLPSANILPFYRRCLELNRYLIGCSFCVSKDTISLVSQRPIEGLSYNELEHIVYYVSHAADSLDDTLSKEFGAKLFSED